MYKKYILCGLFAAVLNVNLSAHAECPVEQIKCADGVHGTKVDTMWSWGSFTCKPCYSGCGRGIDNHVVPYCSVYGGIGADQIDGVGVGFGSVSTAVGDTLNKTAPAIGTLAGTAAKAAAG